MARKSIRKPKLNTKPKIRTGPKPAPQTAKSLAKGRPFYCGNRNYTSCYDYLVSMTNNDPAVDQLFDILNSNVKFNSVKNGHVSIQQIAQEDGYSVEGIFCGGSECGNFYGVGGCNAGQACCGFGGLGIGCNYKFKDKHGSTH